MSGMDGISCILLRASCLTLEINEFRCYEAKIEESEKRRATAGSRTQDTSDLSHECSATELRQPDNHQPSQSSICTAQVILNASVAHLAATQYVLSRTPLGVDWKILSIRKEPMLAEWFTHSKCSEHLASHWK